MNQSSIVDCKLVVLTPIKNEAWILEQFLIISSIFADHIVIADQHSTDGSKDIVRKFPKAHIIENSSTVYDEASRQLALINAARTLFPDSKNVFLCLDADEIFSANSVSNVTEWEQIKTLKPGTTVYFEKPDILYGLENCVRWRDNYFPIGYVDDGRLHQPKSIHSKRVPDNPDGGKVFIENIKVLHLAHSRKNVQSSKLRYYSVIENIQNSKRFYTRRFAYPSFYNELNSYPSENIEKIPSDWLNGWLVRGIHFSNFPDPIYSWHDFEVLKYFKIYGYRNFHLDNIWEFDWEKVRQIAIEEGRDAPATPIKKPSFFLSLFLKMTDRFFSIYRGIVH
jgi:hypothetical protein